MRTRLIARPRSWSALITIIALLFLSGCSRNPLTITIDVTQPTAQVIDDKFTMLLEWHYSTHWSDAVVGRDPDCFARQYPFIREVQLMTATGGCYLGYASCPSWEDRDLFVDPANQANLTDYQFDPLVAAVGNVVRHGLRPYIVLGNVPIKYTSEPQIGAFNVNTMPPADFARHADYIRTLVRSFVDTFGLAEVQTWRWGVLTEYENADWFYDGVSADSTKRAFFKLYDTTVSALEDVLGADYLTVGAHAMAVQEGLWDPTEFLDHVAKGTNYSTGKTGTQLDFLSISYYDKRPGTLRKKGEDLTATIHRLREHALVLGLPNLPFGVDEGRLLSGADKKPLLSRAVAHSYQGAYDAKKIRELHDLQVDWFAVWGLGTGDIWDDGIPTVSHHVFTLAHRMATDRRIQMSLTGRPVHRGNEVNGIAGYDEANERIHVMLYNFAANPNAITKEKPEVVIKNIAPITGDSVTVETWTIDDLHGNFWPAWWDEMGSSLPETAYRNDWSAFSVEVPQVLTDPSARKAWYEREDAYRHLAELRSNKETVPVIDNSVVLNPVLEHHGVVFYELSNVRMVAGTLQRRELASREPNHLPQNHILEVSR